MAAIRACNCASLILAFWRLAEPFCLRLRLRESRLSRASKALWGLGPTMTSPVDKVARAATPKSTPTAPWFSAGRRWEFVGVSTVMEANQRSATREMVAEMILPENRNALASVPT